MNSSDYIRDEENGVFTEIAQAPIAARDRRSTSTVAEVEIHSRKDALDVQSQSSGQSVGKNLQTKSFKQTVERHFKKDRLFNLVHTFLRSIEEERKAGQDLIKSFETARNIKIPICEAKLSHERPKQRRRKRLDIPLFERIEQNRKMRNENAPESDEQSKEVVGELALSAKNEDVKNAHKSVQNETCLDLISDNDSELKHKEAKQGETASLNGRSPEHNVEDEAYRKKIRSRSLPSGLTEKITILEQLQTTQDKEELDKMVLESIISNTSASAISENDTDRSTANETIETNDENNEIDENIMQIPVESDSGSDNEDEICKNVIGLSDDVEYNDDTFTDDTDDEYDDDREFKKLNDPNFFVSNMEYTKMPSSLVQTKLDPISEAEHSAESFQSFHCKSSSNIIEIESKDSLKKIKSSDAYRKPNNMQGNKHASNKFQTTSQNNGTSPKPTHRNTNIRKKSASHKNSPSKVTRNETKGKQKKQLISIDLLGMYEDNEDLQQIKTNKDFVHKPEKGEKESNTNATIPKTKKVKRTKRCRKYDNKPLPPKLLPSPKPLPKRMSSLSRSSANVPQRSVESPEELIETYRSYQSKKERNRYARPDHVLWDCIDLTEKENGVHFDMHDGGDGDDCAWTCGEGSRRDFNNFRSLSITDAIKSVKGSANVPKLLNLREETPRSERVHRLYTDFRHERRDSGYVEYRYINVPPREDSDLVF